MLLLLASLDNRIQAPAVVPRIVTLMLMQNQKPSQIGRRPQMTLLILNPMLKMAHTPSLRAVLAG